MTVRVAIDIGGGFTDLVAVDEQTGAMSWAKFHTTPADLSAGVLDVFRKSRTDPRAVTHLLHGQTLVINSIVQRKGALVGLITTKGYRDILEIQRANRRDIYNLRYRKPEPHVPRYLRLEVEERIASDGQVVLPLEASQVSERTSQLVGEGVESIAVCFINSYANPVHERMAGDLIREAFPQRVVTLSHEVSREWREYERTLTTVLNAYVLPLVDRYLTKLSKDLQAEGMTGVKYMMLSNGGVASFDYVRRVPITTVESGPVAGVVGGIALAHLVGEANVMVLDGGSTTTKASLVENLAMRFTTDYAVGRDQFNPGYPVKIPIVDIVEVGNGGGSIAWVDAANNLRVGPVSAGASPGPACYGWGGKEPTLTDAYLVCGFLNPDYFLGGEFHLREDLADDAIGKIAQRFGTAKEVAASAIINLANDNAAHLLRLISVQRGYDPRDFTLVAHGGSGPMMAPFISQELEIRKILVPVVPPGAFSAWGMLMTDLRHDAVRTLVTRLDRSTSQDAIRTGYRDLEEEIVQVFQAESIAREQLVLLRFADMRYYGQEHVIKVPAPQGAIGDAELRQLEGAFHSAHEREYTFRVDSPVELVNLHVTGVTRVRKPVLDQVKGRPTDPQKALKSRRRIFWGSAKGGESTPIFERALLPVSQELQGPAIVEEPTSTVVVPHGQAFRVDTYGNLVITRR